MMSVHPNEFTLARVRRLALGFRLAASVRGETGGYVFTRGTCLPGDLNTPESYLFKVENDKNGKWYFCRTNDLAEWTPLAVYDTLEGAVSVLKRFIYGDEEDEA